MEIRRAGSAAVDSGTAGSVTGVVRIERLFAAAEPARVTGVLATFEPGARTAWHTHPLGQTLIVTAGVGWVARAGGAVEEVRAGDVVVIGAGERHWHGATAASAMSHIAVQERLGGVAVTWAEQVSEAEYQR